MNKLLIAAIAAIMLPSIAFADVTFQDVTDKMKAGDVRTAEMLTKQIIKDKPDSAKAHYYMGQILIAESDYKGARSELKKAAELDKSLSFAASPDKFRENMDKVQMNLGKAEAPPISTHEDSGWPWGKLFLLLGLGGVAYWWFKRPTVVTTSMYAEQKPHPGANHPAYASTSDRGMQNPYCPAARPSSYAPVQPAPVVNNYNSGSNGLVDGMILGSMMSGHGNTTTNTIIEREAPAKGNDSYSGSSSSSNDSSFDSGDDNRSGGFDSGSDNSSSFDSGGSSFDSGGSSFDSGSSSGD